MGREWASPELRSGRWVRVTRRTKARVFIPMGREELLRLSFSLSVRPQPVEVIVAVNESEVGRFLATPDFSEYQLSTPALFPRGINFLSLRPQFPPQFEDARQILLLDRVTFERVDR